MDTVLDTAPAGSRSGWRPIAAYVVLACALSWLWWLPIALAGQVVRGGATPTHVPGLLGPMVAALLVAGFSRGGPGVAGLLRSMTDWRIGGRWWLVALSPLLLAVGAFVADGLMAGDRPAAADLYRVGGFPDRGGVVSLLVLLVVVNGLGEETGWRGFLQPRLQERLRPIPAVCVLALIWAGWHVPLFVIMESFRGFSAATVVGFLIGMVCGATVLAWLFNHTGSVLAVACWHAAYNLGTATIAARGTVAAVVTTMVIVWASVLIVLEVARGGGVLLPGRDRSVPEG